MNLQLCRITEITDLSHVLHRTPNNIFDDIQQVCWTNNNALQTHLIELRNNHNLPNDVENGPPIIRHHLIRPLERHRNYRTDLNRNNLNNLQAHFQMNHCILQQQIIELKQHLQIHSPHPELNHIIDPSLGEPGMLREIIRLHQQNHHMLAQQVSELY